MGSQQQPALHPAKQYVPKLKQFAYGSLDEMLEKLTLLNSSTSLAFKIVSLMFTTELSSGFDGDGGAGGN